jgi:hypothetical protein
MALVKRCRAGNRPAAKRAERASKTIGSEGDAIALRNKPHVPAQHILFEGVPGIPLPDDNAAVGLVAQSIQPYPESLDINVPSSSTRMPASGPSMSDGLLRSLQ